jgi:hypothetical protein
MEYAANTAVARASPTTAARKGRRYQYSRNLIVATSEKLDQAKTNPRAEQ